MGRVLLLGVGLVLCCELAGAQCGPGELFVDVGPVSTGLLPLGSAIGDLDGDGDLDLAVASLDSTGAPMGVGVFLANGDGSFGPAVGYPVMCSAGTPLAAEWVEIEDLNQDGVLDLVASVNPCDAVNVFLGIGDGTFLPAVAYDSGGDGPFLFVLRDFSGDAYVDVAVVNTLSQDVTVLLGGGDGTFTPTATYGVGLQAQGIAAADFDGDGNLDLALTYAFAVQVRLGAGDGTFLDPIELPVFVSRLVAAADVDDDGLQDLVVAASTGDLFVYGGLGDGTFTLLSSHAIGDSSPWWMSVGDVDQDGLLDVVITRSGGHDELRVLRGIGGGTFQDDGASYATGQTPWVFTLGDLNGDGSLDAVVSNLDDDNVNIFLNQCALSGFVRGDCNGDEFFDVSDAIHGLGILFLGIPSTCDDGCDSNDDGVLDISDPIFVLMSLFVPGSPPPRAPHSDCGQDPTDDLLDCSVWSCH